MSPEHDFELGTELKAVGESVARLSRPKAPPGLAARAVARVMAASAPMRQRLWVLRPITNPFARCAAAALIMMALVPLSDLELARNMGVRIEDKFVGPHVVDRVETIIDGVLLRGSNESYSQSELDAFNNVQSTNKRALRIQVRALKLPTNLGL